MKTIPPPCPEPESGPKYWRSLDQLAEKPEFRQWVEREFPAGASELSDPVTRRSFVKLMSASFLLAGAGFGLTGCRKPVEKIYPFSKMPEGYVHGVAKFYATAMPTRGTAIPLLAKSNDGRPTKLEGNGQHPDSNGGTDRYTQASILDLYDPDRATRYAKNGSADTRDNALTALSDLSKAAQANGGAGLYILAGQSSSPSRMRVRKALAEKLPKASWHEYEPVDFDIHRRAATQAFGKPVAPNFKLQNAKVILSLDCDFIGSEENAFLNIRRFAQGRKTAKHTDSMSRLYVAEALMSLTGVNADHRLRVATSQVSAVAARLAVEVLKQAGLGDVGANIQELAGSKAIAANEKWIVECAKDLLAHRGESLVMVGYRQPLAIHLLANAINNALGNFGKTIDLLPAEDSNAGSIETLAQALNDGKVETLVILGGNPVYNAPADLNWAQAKAKTVIRLGYSEDESASKNGWNLPLAHFLESWGDARTADGTLVPVQPLIEPLFGGLTEIEVLARIAGLDVTSPYEIVRETFRGIGGNDEEHWKLFLHDGFLANSAAQAVEGSFNLAAVASGITAAPVTALAATSKDNLEVVFHRDYRVDDGRFNNNGWMQELPDPITKMTWENVILMSVKTAKELGLYAENKENNRIKAYWAKLEVNGRAVEGPVWTSPGQADNTIALALGYGRATTGRVGRESGFDAYKLRTSMAMHYAQKVKISDTGKKHPLSVTQDHGAMEGRPIIREATLKEYGEHPHFAKGFNTEEPPGGNRPMYPNPFDEVLKKNIGHHQWGMAIDLSACVGCSTCMIACQSENNIPIVGKEQVSNNREMHWIRVDRYYTGDPDKEDGIQVINQPMLCQHCEAAPCENVCPVNATTHDQEGLNVMVYNRCVGTRYCSNNCPYKVRRFNFFDYNRRTFEQLKGPFYTTPLLPTKGQAGVVDWLKDPDRGSKPTDEWELLQLVKNPDVTVRMRGVMEKCSYCVQRIQQAEIAQKVKARDTDDVTVPRDSFKTACQQACPAEAITFGNLLDSESAVSKQKAQDRNYKVLDFLNTRPRTTYLARLRNPNPTMPDTYETPHSTEEFIKKNDVNPLEESGEHAPEGAEAHGKKGEI